MSPRRPLLVLSWLALSCALGACADRAPAGTGFLTVQDLDNPASRGRFTGEPVETTARLVARDNGCVNVVVDGVERVPLWPEGSSVAPVEGTPDQYAVTLPGGEEISAGGDSGDTFTALGVVDQGSGQFTAEPDPPDGKVDTFLAFCAVEAQPISFPDASTFVVHADSS